MQPDASRCSVPASEASPVLPLHATMALYKTLHAGRGHLPASGQHACLTTWLHKGRGWLLQRLSLPAGVRLCGACAAGAAHPQARDGGRAGGRAPLPGVPMPAPPAPSARCILGTGALTSGCQAGIPLPLLPSVHRALRARQRVSRPTLLCAARAGTPAARPAGAAACLPRGTARRQGLMLPPCRASQASTGTARGRTSCLISSAPRGLSHGCAAAAGQGTLPVAVHIRPGPAGTGKCRCSWTLQTSCGLASF